MNDKKYLIPLFSSIILIIGIYLGLLLSKNENINSEIPVNRDYQKLNQILDYIEKEYVDTINRKQLIEMTINTLIEKLDPHSAYLSNEILSEANESLDGNFDGIGVEFNIQKDTIVVVGVISGGPSDLLGIMPGDRIIKVNKEKVAGIGIKNNEVIKRLRGKNGTIVKVSILRNNKLPLIEYEIKRGKIPIKSVDISYMITENTGYIKINRFAATTYEEYIQSFNSLDLNKMKTLIIDLRGNSGGYLETAIAIADEFLSKDKIIVYTKGRSILKKSIYKATSLGEYEKGNLYVLIDEGSASASEILAGAIQDNDRGIIIGRRSFGKGLVQEQLSLTDSSAIRLTIARYYTATGRCIQKPYNHGNDDYYMDYYNRYESGELQHEDSIHVNDSLKYKTAKGKIVYGGGGIKPDIFVPLDTTGFTSFLLDINRKGLIVNFAFKYVDKNRSKFSNIKDYNSFKKNFVLTKEIFESFIKYCAENKVNPSKAQISKSRNIIEYQLRAFIARYLISDEGFYPEINKMDNIIDKAISIK